MNRLAPDAQAVVDEVVRRLDEREIGIVELMERAMTFLHAEAMSVFVLDRAAGELVAKHAVGAACEEIPGLRLQLGQGVVGWVVQYSEDLIVPETAMDARFYSGVDEQTGFVTRSILCVPMLEAGQAVGAVEAMNKTTGHFNDEDMLFLKEIAQLVVDYA